MSEYKDWESNWDKEKYVPVFVEKLSEAEATYALREAWKRVYKAYPSDKSLALLWAQSALETGRWKVIRNNNFGNIKKKHYKKLSWTEIPDDGHKWTMFATGENLWDNKTKNSKWHWFEPPHYQTHFRSYDTVIDGAEDYIKLVSQKKRYIKAWAEVMKGDPRAFSHELRVAGYYTALEEKYTAGVVRLVDEFMSKKDALLSFKPEPKVKEPPTVLEVQKDTEIHMEEIQILGYISPSTNEEPDKSPGKEPRSIDKAAKTGILMFIAAGLASAYAWFTGLF